ncbi:MAG: Na(+)-translocating NADH-quinone reductase subunit A [Bdellovibrionales bacterium]|nr:Na(+)-translocating NADH-quinone reductase subunit A [Bdellovibrionales bacterium]
MDFVIKKGLSLNITGEVPQTFSHHIQTSKVAILGSDYVDMKPTMQVEVGDFVKTGQTLFACKKNQGLVFTSPSTGKVIEINRGEKRVFESIVLEQSSNVQHHSFSSYLGDQLSNYSPQTLRSLFIESGWWTSLRQRPYGKVANVKGKPYSIFVTAIDTNPFAPQPSIMVGKKENEFEKGLLALAALDCGPVYVCLDAQTSIHTPTHPQIHRATFDGPHPAGLAGTHIHMIDPVHAQKYVWHVGYQDVIALGHLICTGTILNERMISVAGPHAKKASIVTCPVGACISEITHDFVKKDTRVISGSIFHGHIAKGSFDFLGKYQNQVTLIREDHDRIFMGWHSPGLDRFSVKNVFVSKLFPNKKFDFTSTTHGSLRAMVPVGSFEKVMPLDILPTQLLRSLVAKDTDSAQDLGCLELIEEDIALLTFVAPGKVDFGPLLRANLQQIEKEG